MVESALRDGNAVHQLHGQTNDRWWRQRLRRGFAASRLGILPAVCGLFVFYVAHDALQERAFRKPGFSFGWFMTAFEIGTMFVCAYVWEGGKTKAKAMMPGRSHLLVLVVFIALSQGTGSVALNFVNYHIKVAFKSCKLVPTMIFSQLMAGHSYSLLEYLAAVLMCLSLMTLGLADARAVNNDAKRTKAQALGFILLTLAVCSDAFIPNLQELILRQLHCPISDMVVVTNFCSFLLVLLFITASGELQEALHYCFTNRGTATMLLLQSLSAYCGLRCYLSVIRALSGVAGVLTTSARKVVTIVLSFLLFEKPFNRLHAIALVTLGTGVSLAASAKHRIKKVSPSPRQQDGPAGAVSSPPHCV